MTLSEDSPVGVGFAVPALLLATKMQLGVIKKRGVVMTCSANLTTPGCKLNTIMFIGFNRTTQFFRLFEGPSVCWASQENTSSKELSA